MIKFYILSRIPSFFIIIVKTTWISVRLIKENGSLTWILVVFPGAWRLELRLVEGDWSLVAAELDEWSLATSWSLATGAWWLELGDWSLMTRAWRLELGLVDAGHPIWKCANIDFSERVGRSRTRRKLPFICIRQKTNSVDWGKGRGMDPLANLAKCMIYSTVLYTIQYMV